MTKQKNCLMKGGRLGPVLPRDRFPKMRYSEIHVLRNEVFLKYMTDNDIYTFCNYALGWSGLLCRTLDNF